MKLLFLLHLVLISFDICDKSDGLLNDKCMSEDIIVV